MINHSKVHVGLRSDDFLFFVCLILGVVVVGCGGSCVVRFLRVRALYI